MAAFPLLEGPPVLDLANTLPSRREGRDLLSTAEQLADWLRASGLFPAPDPAATAALDDFRRLRAAARDLLDAVSRGEQPAPAALEAINAAARRAPGWTRLELDRGRLTGTTVRRGGEAERILAEIAASAADLVTGQDRHLVTACPGPGCGLFFLARDRRRRWCDSRTCGNRVRVERHRRRHHPSPRADDTP